MRRTASLCLFLFLLGPVLRAAEPEESVPIATATSPDGRLILSSTGTSSGCDVSLREAATGRVLTTISIAEVFGGQEGNEITALWQADSSAVALNAQGGRSVAVCRVLCLAEGRWREAAFPAKTMQALAKKNTIPGDKAESYFSATAWGEKDRLTASYQGNAGAVNALEFALVRSAKPHLDLLATKVVSD